MGSTLAELRSRTRTRADAVGNDFFSDAEINDYLNTGLGELHDILVLAFEDYYVNSREFSTVSGQSTYPLSSIGAGNFYKCLGVDVADSGETLRVRRFSFGDRNRFKSNILTRGRGEYSDLMYQVRGNAIELMPVPDGESAMTLWYIPSFEKLVADTDTVDSSVMSNWEEYAILTAVVKMKEKEELSSTVIERELASLTERIESAAENRDVGEPYGITDELTGVEIGILGR